MIKPEELRRNNLIEFDGKIFKLYSISEHVITCDILLKSHIEGFKIEAFTCQEINPIELTEEWLLKFGFDVEDNGLATYYGSEHDFTIDTDNNKTWKIFGYKGGFVHIYHVHQLQNLYFALAGSELTIKEGK
jgi:hypothetical protein